MAIAWAVQEWRIRTKQKLADALGGRCNKCKYAKCIAALCFHHVNPKEKSFQITDGLAHPKSWQKLAEEARKCMLLCLVCHAEFHAGLWKLDEVQRFDFQEPEPEPEFDTCVVCGSKAKKHQLCCGRVCAAKRREMIDWPSKDNLLEMLRTMSVLALARQLRVSDTAIRKRLRKYSEIR